MHAAPHIGAMLLRRPRWLWRGTVAALATLAGLTSLDVQQRRFIFQTGLANDGARSQAATGLQDQWITFDSAESGAPTTLHGLWLPQPLADAPVLLFLHGARWDVRGSAQRMRSLHQLGFSVLGIDYRGFGRSTPGLPSERTAGEDAYAAWQWLAQRHPSARRFVYGHSLGGAIAVQLASRIEDAAGLIVEATFTSIAEVIGSFSGRWRPRSTWITQRFDAAARMPAVKVPTLVVHGSDDPFIRPELGRALFERATAPKRFMLVQGGSHYDTHALGRDQYRVALRELFDVRA